MRKILSEMKKYWVAWSIAALLAVLTIINVLDLLDGGRRDGPSVADWLYSIFSSN